jgi:hypothetical protein
MWDNFSSWWDDLVDRNTAWWRRTLRHNEEYLPDIYQAAGYIPVVGGWFQSLLSFSSYNAFDPALLPTGSSAEGFETWTIDNWTFFD